MEGLWRVCCSEGGHHYHQGTSELLAQLLTRHSVTPMSTRRHSEGREPSITHPTTYSLLVSISGQNNKNKIMALLCKFPERIKLYNTQESTLKMLQSIVEINGICEGKHLNCMDMFGWEGGR